MWKVSLARKCESLFKYRHLNSEEPFPNVGPGRSCHSSDKLKVFRNTEQWKAKPEFCAILCVIHGEADSAPVKCLHIIAYS